MPVQSIPCLTPEEGGSSVGTEALEEVEAVDEAAEQSGEGERLVRLRTADGACGFVERARVLEADRVPLA